MKTEGLHRWLLLDARARLREGLGSGGAYLHVNHGVVALRGQALLIWLVKVGRGLRFQAHHAAHRCLHDVRLEQFTTFLHHHVFSVVFYIDKAIIRDHSLKVMN